MISNNRKISIEWMPTITIQIDKTIKENLANVSTSNRLSLVKSAVIHLHMYIYLPPPISLSFLYS